MAFICTVLPISAIVTAAIASLYAIHKKDKKIYESYIGYIDKDYTDETISNKIDLSADNAFDYVFLGDALPLGRVSAFLNYFDRNIYNEEPYAYYCKRSSRDNEFREYGCVIARTGVYLLIENSGNKNLKDKDKSVLKARENRISFVGLSHIFQLGTYILTVNYNPVGIFDHYEFFSIKDELLRRQIIIICKAVIENGINYSLLL